MTIRKLDDGRYQLDTRTGGRGSKRVRRLFHRKSDAVSFERYMLGKIERKEWDDRPQRDRRPLSEILDRWWLYHGQSLKNGEIEKRQLAGTIAAMGDPSVCELDKRMLAHYRIARASRGIKASTINRELYRLSGMFSVLIRIGEFSGENPAHGLPPLAENNPETAYLTTEESAVLLSALEGDYRRVALLCLSTGARWGEVGTHFMMNGGNIITLQRILGHATIQQTMTYAHFAPDFLQEAVNYNPIAGMNLE